MYLKPFIEERARALLPLHLVTVGSDFDQKPVKRPQGAPFHHIFFIEQGSGRFDTADGSVSVGAGKAVFIKKLSPVGYRGEGDLFKTGWVTFEGPAVDALLEYFNAADLEILDGGELLPLLRECVRAAERGADAATLSRLTYGLVVSFFELRDRVGRHSALVLAQDFIKEHFVRDLSVEEIAAGAGISASLLYRLFRAEGLTPVEYLRRVRIERAKRYLLEEPSMLVSEVAAHCGFAESAYFCKVFRDAEGLTPKAYRIAFLGA